MALIPLQDIVPQQHIPLGEKIQALNSAANAWTLQEQSIQQNRLKLADQQRQAKDTVALNDVVRQSTDPNTMLTGASKISAEAYAQIKEMLDKASKSDLERIKLNTENAIADKNLKSMDQKNALDILIKETDNRLKQFELTTKQSEAPIELAGKTLSNQVLQSNLDNAGITAPMKEFNDRFMNEFLPSKGIDPAGLNKTTEGKLRTEFRQQIESGQTTKQSETVMPSAGKSPILANYNPKTGQYTDTQGNLLPDALPYFKPTAGQGGLTDNQEALLVGRLTNQWTAATKTATELDRQVQIMQTGLDAARRGDLNAGAQAVLVTFQKILDPSSVVRESEYARSPEGLALMTRIEGAYERMKSGGAGVPLDELEKFAQLGREMASGASGHMNAVKERIGKNADYYKVPRSLIFEDYDLSKPGNGTAVPAVKPGIAPSATVAAPTPAVTAPAVAPVRVNPFRK